MEWTTTVVEKLNATVLESLFENRIAAIRVPGFLDEAASRAAVGGIKRHGLHYYENVFPPIGRAGITQFEHRQDAASRARYFAAAPAANQTRQEMFAGSGDLVGQVMDALAGAWPAEVAVAREPGGEQYFAGLVRVIGEGLLHCDWAPHDAPSTLWSIGAVNAQITWNVFCQMPRDGGVTVVYNRPWTAAAESFHIPDSYGYSDALVEGCDQVRIEPSVGDLVLFNSRNFHRIESGAGDDRISVSSFIGRFPDSTLTLWS
ncbi:2OG-Fe(II)-dependent halogenase WelO5 family protein [Mangrovihabitans endophyticus]|uniref:2OG-Fe(II) oxygenase superfamily protein n=1 Tax=Mangrovihabitans endophyticus TaxID=1751298 RepID=A0A8J3FM01_9ACTN|nr:histidine kinase [Mangrovihabitans endophyticus]GGK72658.1 hypothetical protein GCM10012284_03080 [Mangrovihabitans endophyticus]